MHKPLPTWKKRGRIFNRENGIFFKSHSSRVVPYYRSNGDLRLFFSSRCADDIMHPTFVDVNPDDPAQIVGTSENSLLALGQPGSFDDSGITLGSICNVNSDCFVYYTGWKRRRYSVTFELSIGLARLLDDGERLEKVFAGPIIAQDRHHPLLAAGPYVIPVGDHFKMWYCSGTAWRQYAHGAEPIYTVYSAKSGDGINWQQDPPGREIIPYMFEGEVISAPVVYPAEYGYVMYYSHRGSADHLSKRYSIGAAVSIDGINWDRRDAEVGLTESKEGWDSEMMCYPAVVSHRDNTYMFYSGNGVGRGGIGYAVCDTQLNPFL